MCQAIFHEHFFDQARNKVREVSELRYSALHSPVDVLCDIDAGM